jgi:copper chaperone CopZ
MSDNSIKTIYRVDLASSSCRSCDSLVALVVGEIPGVEAVSVSPAGALVAVASAERDLYEEITREVVSVGLDPMSVTLVPFERVVDVRPLALSDAEALGLIAPPREPVRAAVETVQRISVAVTDGYDPEVILLSAGVPAEITFSEGHGCLAKVVFPDFGIEADLEHGGAVVHVPALEPGSYRFSCGMNMVHGELVVE